MKTSTQLKALIRNLSREKSMKPEIILRSFMLERFLERISLSEYKNKFILKGGMLVASFVGIETRSTMDMDTTVIGFPLSKERLRNVINQVLDVPIDDGVSMTLEKLEDIHDESDYPGIRVTIIAVLDKTKQRMKVDVTTGDPITPQAIDYRFSLLLEKRTIAIMAYNIETVLAEKLETILSRGTTTTRMRDYYDVYILMQLYEQELSWDHLKEAFKETSKHRGSYTEITSGGSEIVRMIEKSDVLRNLWNQYCLKNEYASEVLWSDAVMSFKKIYDKSGNVLNESG